MQYLHQNSMPCFEIFLSSVPAAPEVTFLRRSGGQWVAWALASIMLCRSHAFARGRLARKMLND
jgi:hypothetical protein